MKIKLENLKIDFLYKKCATSTNKKKIREFKFVFEDIKPIYDYNSCFSKIKLGRDMKNYEQVLKMRLKT